MPHKRSLPSLFIKVVLFLLGCGIGFFAVSNLTALFHVRTVEIKGLPEKEKTIITSLVKGKSTILFDDEKYKKMFQSRIPSLKDVSLTLYYPDKIIISGNIATSVVNLVSDEGYLSLSENGVILEKKRGDTVPSPSVYMYQTVHHNAYQAGQSINYSSVKKAIQFVKLLKSEGYSVERVDIDSVDMIACKVAEVDILFSQTKSIETQQHEFTQIAKQMKIGALRVVRLDLRFSKPVVELKK